MDLHRPDIAAKNKRKRLIISALAVVSFMFAVSILLLYKPGPYEVERELVFTGVVNRGEMLQQIRGSGTLEPAEVRWISARTSGRVERIHVLPGAEVDFDTLIVELSNPELTQEKQNAQLQVKTDEANFIVRKAHLESNLLQSLSLLTKAESDYKQAELNARIDKQLFDQGLESRQASQRSSLRLQQLELQLSLERKRYAFSTESTDAEITAERTRLEQSKARLNLLEKQVDALFVKAGYQGLLQKQDLREGQRVSLGQSLAQVVNPKSLKAQIRIAEYQAKRLSIGLSAEVDTRNGIVLGQVARIDPNVEEGTVAVDITLKGDLPVGARPNSTVEGTIEIDKVSDVFHVSRPIYAQADSKTKIFKFIEGTNIAEQISVTFGRSSINLIEVLEGLEAGDKIILSDTSEWLQHEKIKIN